jgi:hypothetical protein
MKMLCLAIKPQKDSVSLFLKPNAYVNTLTKLVFKFYKLSSRWKGLTYDDPGMNQAFNTYFPNSQNEAFRGMN